MYLTQRQDFSRAAEVTGERVFNEYFNETYFKTFFNWCRHWNRDNDIIRMSFAARQVRA